MAAAEFEDLAKRILKGELKRRGITYVKLAELLKTVGVHETEVAMGVNEIRLL